MRMIASGAPSACASSSAAPIHFSVAGSIVPLSSIEGTVCDSRAPTAPGRSSSPARVRKSQACIRRRMSGLSATRMPGRLRSKLTYANVMATLAVFIALGGGAYAVSLAKNSVKSKQIKNGAVKSKDVGNGQIGAADTAPALRLQCPPETRYLEGACIELAARSTESWLAAMQTCVGADRRLPSVAELQGARLEPGINLATLEWTSALDASPPEVKANVVINNGLVASDPITDSHGFRCAAPPLG